jgi:hypothetical protein
MSAAEPPADTWTLRLIGPTTDAVRRIEKFVEELSNEGAEPPTMIGYDTFWGDPGVVIR